MLITHIIWHELRQDDLKKEQKNKNLLCALIVTSMS